MHKCWGLFYCITLYTCETSGQWTRNLIKYLWVVTGTSAFQNTVLYIQFLANYMEKKGYPKWRSVQRVVEKAEPAVFKAYFKTWKEPQEQLGLGRVFTQRQMSAGKS